MFFCIKKIKVNIYQLVICRKMVVNEKIKSAKGQLTLLVVLELSNFSHCCIRILAVFENNITRERVTACELNHIVNQWFSTRIPPVQSRGSARCYMNFHFILLIELNAVFCVRQLNYCTGVPRVTGMFSWGSALAKRLKPLLWMNNWQLVNN